MATYTLSPQPGVIFLDDNGAIVPGGLVWTYEAGTSTPADTYQTSGGTLHSNPIELDGDGLPPGGSIYLEPGRSYKYLFEEPATPPAHGATIRTWDNIAAVPFSTTNQDVTGTAGETFADGDCAYIADGSGSTMAGQFYKADADNAYSSLTPIIAFAIGAITLGDQGVFRTGGKVDLAGPLTPGATYYVSATAGLITSSPPTNTARVVGQAESATSLVIGANPPPVFQGDRAQIVIGAEEFV